MFFRTVEVVIFPAIGTLCYFSFPIRIHLPIAANKLLHLMGHLGLAKEDRVSESRRLLGRHTSIPLPLTLERSRRAGASHRQVVFVANRRQEYCSVACSQKMRKFRAGRIKNPNVP